MTRPKRHFVFAAIPRPLASSKFLKNWMDFLEEHADLRYPDASELFS
ncbi:hypothetical protein PMAA_045620 [Talaromyces marneffei ATCC 18224]|uniref:Uncharacterized protein n=1 Tax=Talaromyces marneffei (strain ATCC 18224 / CBS 334.59 / QM 7333) TaxID=441960 RepID=B6QR11_TALMQ|nr:hypothetical protein PMAA_045620 [Talaromyces marneffei ATCC 18224]